MNQDGSAPSGDAAPGMPEIVADSEVMRECLEQMEAAAEAMAPVMFLGEKGTGKRFLALRLHRLSPRRAQPCLVVSCADFTEGDISQRFLGYGAAGELHGVKGILDGVGGGAVILSDLEQLPVGLQKELCAFLSGYDLTGEAGGERLGARILSTLRTVNDPAFRVFSEELINIMGETLVRVPPLRERREDIPTLARAALDRAVAESGRGPKEFSPGAMDFLLHYDFPGNIDELNRLVSKAARWAPGVQIFREDFGVNDSNAVSAPGKHLSTLAEMERRHIGQVLTHTGWKRRAAAQILGLSETLLTRKMKLYGFDTDK